MKVEGLFPTPIGIADIGRSFSDAELKFILEQDVYDNTGNKISKDHKMLNNNVMASLKKIVSGKLNEYFNAVHAPADDVSIHITQSWSNYTKKGEFHHIHSHQNSFVSGVLYVNADEKKDKIFFYKDEYRQLDITPKEWNHFNSKSWWIPVKTGDIVMFPSSLTHAVQTVETEEPRVSIAFNTFLSGTIGADMDLTLLKL